MEQDILNILVIWRGKQLTVQVNPNCKVHEFGQKLQNLTNVKPDTLRLLVPQSTNKTSRMIAPFSDEHSSLSLQETFVLEGKPIRMMGAFDNEIKEVSQASSKSDLRILGFDEEEKRLRERRLNRPQASLKLPQGAYIFGDFRTLHLPGIELNPPPSEALRRMHMLACDPGIIAIMNKHRWRVGIMTELAPVGYVGVSPKCLLGFNKNQGEEISLRLRTDDLKGFRKYESIKKTLLHELAHMVYSEHNSDFFALNKQLDEEAASLDWTKSTSHTLSGHKFSDYEEDLYLGASSSSSGQKLGGASNSWASAWASSVSAAYNRFLNTAADKPDFSNKDHLSHVAMEPDSNQGEFRRTQEKNNPEPDPDDTLNIENSVKPSAESSTSEAHDEPDPDDCLDNTRMFEPDPDDCVVGEAMMSIDEPDPDDSGVGNAMKSSAEPDPDDSGLNKDDSAHRKLLEPDSDDAGLNTHDSKHRKLLEPDPDDSVTVKTMSKHNREVLYPDGSVEVALSRTEPVSNGSDTNGTVNADHDPDEHMDGSDSDVLQRIEESTAAICARIHRAIETLRSEVTTAAEAASALQTLFKIIRNVIEHPQELKFRRLRKANPQLQRTVVNYKAAMEVLTCVGFYEDTIFDDVGRAETYLVLKRNDPGLLWLAKSSLEVSIA